MYSTDQSLRIGSELLAQKGFLSPRLDCELLLGHVLKLSREQLYCKDSSPLSSDQWRQFNRLLRSRLVDEKPIAHITGRRAFYQNDFMVSEGVFVPRPETEILVAQVLITAKEFDSASPLEIIDVCTGSGAIAISIMAALHHRQHLSVEAIDISPAALNCTEKNAENILSVSQRQSFIITRSSLLDKPALPAPNIIVSNPPYLSDSQMAALPKEVRNHDPLLALYGGGDGLAAIRKIAARSCELLAEKGYLLIEVADDQSEAAAEILRANFLVEPEVFNDLAGKPRVLKIRKRFYQC
jgi:release factor glutamine methyltransferase